MGVYALIMALLVGAGADRMIRKRYTGPPPLALQIEGFEMRLGGNHELAAPLDAIAHGTTPNTVVLVDSIEVYAPVFAQRAMYAPSRTESLLLGIGVQAEEMLGRFRGHGREFVRERQDVTRRLFRGAEHLDRMTALGEVRALARPLAILLERDRHAGLIESLTAEGSWSVLHEDDHWAVWLEAPGELRVGQATPP